MLGDGGEGDIEMRAEFLHGPGTVQQQIKERAPVRIGDGLKNVGLENIGGDCCCVHIFKFLLK